MRGPGVNIPELKEPKVQERALNIAERSNKNPIDEIKEISNKRAPP